LFFFSTILVYAKKAQSYTNLPETNVPEVGQESKMGQKEFALVCVVFTFLRYCLANFNLLSGVLLRQNCFLTFQYSEEKIQGFLPICIGC